MAGPKVTIDLEKIERNARTVTAACGRAGIDVFGVTKAPAAGRRWRGRCCVAA